MRNSDLLLKQRRAGRKRTSISMTGPAKTLSIEKLLRKLTCLFFAKNDIDQGTYNNVLRHRKSSSLNGGFIEFLVLSFGFCVDSMGYLNLMFLNRQKLESHLPCLILLDINLPLMNGREVLDALKKDEVFKRIPVVVFTTSTGQRDQLLCEAYGVEMVTKPNRVYDFKKVLSHLLARCIL